jgi:hypothetical protein
MTFKHLTHSRIARSTPRQLLSTASALAGLVVAWGCGTAPMHAAADWERGANLEPSKTFAVARSPFLPKELTTEQAALLAIVENTTKNELTKKGYHEAAADQADLIATPSFIKRKRSDTVDASLYCGSYDVKVTQGTLAPPATALQGTCEETYITQYDEGTLLIDMYDTKLSELVWHGWASAEMPQAGSSVTPQQFVERATVDILNKFPP